MHCKKAAVLLQLYIDNQLMLEKMRALEAHLAGCTACSAELVWLEEAVDQLKSVKSVAEPEDLTVRIMQRVAASPARSTPPKFSLLRPSLPEILTAVLLATIATFASLLQQPSVRAILPFANGHDSLSLAFLHALHLFPAVDIGTLTLGLWVIGTLLGVFITLVFAGTEVRSRWLRVMVEHLPVR